MRRHNEDGEQVRSSILPELKTSLRSASRQESKANPCHFVGIAACASPLYSSGKYYQKDTIAEGTLPPPPFSCKSLTLLGWRRRAGFQLGSPPTFYNLTTTATFSGPVSVCINYSGVAYSDPSELALFHFENGGWVNVTTSLDTANTQVCGNVTSLSPFAVFNSIYKASIQQPINTDKSSVFNSSRGVVPVKFALAATGVATCALPPANISLRRTAGTAIGLIDESVYEMSADTGTFFRISGCQYLYNFGIGVTRSRNVPGRYPHLRSYRRQRHICAQVIFFFVLVGWAWWIN